MIVDKKPPLNGEQIDQLASDIINRFSGWDAESKRDFLVGALGNVFKIGAPFTSFSNVDWTACVLVAIAYEEDKNHGAIDNATKVLEGAGVLRAE